MLGRTFYKHSCAGNPSSCVKAVLVIMLQTALATVAKQAISCYKCDQNAVASLANETRMAAMGTVDPSSLATMLIAWHWQCYADSHNYRLKDKRFVLPTVDCISGCWRTAPCDTLPLPTCHCSPHRNARGNPVALLLQTTTRAGPTHVLVYTELDRVPIA